MRLRRFAWTWLLLGCVCLGTSCGPSAQLTQLSVTDLFSGYYDFGVIAGQNKLVPSVSFRLKNGGKVPISEVQLTVSFWQEGADGENDSKEVRGIASAALVPDAATDPILVRSDVGYTLQQARAELFANSQFKDFVAKVFAKRGGKIVPLGEFKIAHQIIPQSTARLP